MSSIDPTSTTPDLTASAGTVAAAPTAAPAEVQATTQQPAQPVLAAPPRRSSGLAALAIVGIVVVSVVMLIVVVWLIGALGPDAFALGGIMALVPLAIVFFGVRWVDRWEPEPRLAVVFAFLWGAAVAVAIALLVGTAIDIVYQLGGGGDPFVYDILGSVVQAPLVEEGGKGLGLLVLFWAARKHFDGPVDGIVYAAWIAGGFAFTENILYFGAQLLETGQLFSPEVFMIFLIRGIMSPFAHVMFTLCIGVALGFAARRGVGAFGAIGFYLLGLIPAVALHALWNGALYVVTDFFGYYFAVQVPLFVGAVLLAVFLRRQESKITRDRLAEYAAVGWFNPDEVVALATPAGRRNSMAWARQRGKAREMKRYIHEATRLAFARQRIITGRQVAAAQGDEAVLLSSVVDARRALATGPAVSTAPPPASA